MIRTIGDVSYGSGYDGLGWYGLQESFIHFIYYERSVCIDLGINPAASTTYGTETRVESRPSLPAITSFLIRSYSEHPKSPCDFIIPDMYKTRKRETSLVSKRDNKRVTERGKSLAHQLIGKEDSPFVQRPGNTSLLGS